MHINSTPKNAIGRSAEPAETIAFLEKALGTHHRFHYQEENVARGLFWGAVDIDALNFPPMGKGASPEACKAAALAETAEWLALRRVRDLPGAREANQEDLDHPVTLESLLGHVATATPDLLAKVKAVDKARRWVRGVSLINGEEREVPLEYVQAISGTNGLAAGNTLEEAVVQACFEIFERRAAITAVKHHLVLPTIDPDTIQSDLVLKPLQSIREAGIKVVLKDVSFGGELPCVGAYVVQPDVPGRFQAHHILKVAAHADRAAAVASCLQEFAQVAKFNRKGPRPTDDFERLLCQDETDNFLPLFWFGYVPLQTAPFLLQGEKTVFDPGEASQDFLEDIRRIKDIAARLDKDVVVVDLTDPEIGFPVVQVVMPGYSDILPYHPKNSPVLLSGWTRELSMGAFETEQGDVRNCTAQGFFPDW